MGKKLEFNGRYFMLAVLLFIIEILIAIFAHDKIVRPYIGDLLVVILIYCFVKSFINTPFLKTALLVLLFSFGIETLQYFHFVDRVGLGKSKYASIAMGTSFEWTDLIAYSAGVILVIYVETLLAKRRLTKNY